MNPECENPPAGGSRKLLILLAAGVVILCALHFTPLAGEVKELRILRSKMDGGGLVDEVLFALISTVLVAVGMPRLIFFGLGGVLLGFGEGLAVAMLASLAGSLINFRLLRWGGRDWVRRRFSHRRVFSKITDIKPTVMSVAFVRQLPVSNLIINACLALSEVRSRTFLLGSMIGFLPQGVAATLIGSGTSQDVAWRGAVQLGGAALILLSIPCWVWHLRKNRMEAAKPSLPVVP